MGELESKRHPSLTAVCEVCGEMKLIPQERDIPKGWMRLYYTPDVRRCSRARFAGYLCPDHVTCIMNASGAEAMEIVWKAVRNHAAIDREFELWLEEILKDIPETVFTAADNPARWYICEHKAENGVELPPLGWTEKRMKSIDGFLKEAEIFEGDCPDMVNHPPHYTRGGIECIDAIEASMSAEEFAGYLKGNVMKYLWRYRNKGRETEDLSKARWYLNKLTEKADKEQ